MQRTLPTIPRLHLSLTPDTLHGDWDSTGALRGVSVSGSTTGEGGGQEQQSLLESRGSLSQEDPIHGPCGTKTRSGEATCGHECGCWVPGPV